MTNHSVSLHKQHHKKASLGAQGLPDCPLSHSDITLNAPVAHFRRVRGLFLKESQDKDGKVTSSFLLASMKH